MLGYLTRFSPIDAIPAGGIVVVLMLGPTPRRGLTTLTCLVAAIAYALVASDLVSEILTTPKFIAYYLGFGVGCGSIPTIAASVGRLLPAKASQSSRVLLGGLSGVVAIRVCFAIWMKCCGI